MARALDAVGDRWTLLIVRELLGQGPCRYTDLMNGLPGIATNLLVDRLNLLEESGLVCRESAPPPVATTLYHLTAAGEELESVLNALGRWGIRFMTNPMTNADQFRSHWLAFPVSLFLKDSDPEGPPVSIQLNAEDQPAVIEASDGEVRTRTGTAPFPDLELSGPPQLILGVLSGWMSIDDAKSAGLQATGTTAVLDRLRRQPIEEGAHRGDRTTIPRASPTRMVGPAPGAGFSESGAGIEQHVRRSQRG
jgi:DNA-binding HxlR family transcriptional regulator